MNNKEKKSPLIKKKGKSQKQFNPVLCELLKNIPSATVYTTPSVIHH